MEENCSVLTPEQRRFNEIIKFADAALEEDLWRLIRATQGNAVKQLDGSPYNTPSEDYFAFGILQGLFLRLCGADRETREGGNAALAKRITDNLINLSQGWSD
jgi:hypothetical protein